MPCVGVVEREERWDCSCVGSDRLQLRENSCLGVKQLLLLRVDGCPRDESLSRLTEKMLLMLLLCLKCSKGRILCNKGRILRSKGRILCH